MLDKKLKHHMSWDNFVNNSIYLDDMIDFINKLQNYSPDEDKVFRFLSTNIKNAKCVILGMDPYPSIYIENNQIKKIATGRSFEVANITYFTDKYKQTSLANIYKSLIYLKYGKIYNINEIRNKKLDCTNIHDRFDKMEKSGVVFLNATLTTEINNPDSHKKYWGKFMDECLNYMVCVNPNLKWLVWGKNAFDRVNGIVDEKNIIYTCHPASRVNNDFVKSCCFSKIKNIEWI